MTIGRHCALLLPAMAVLFTAGCDITGKVEQGRVIAYDKQAGRATLIREAGPGTSKGVLPPITVKVPADADEMGPAPAAGKLLSLDTKAREIVLFDAAAKEFRTISYTPVQERHNVAKSPGPPKIDKAAKTITIYSAAAKTVLTFAATDELLAMPADTWRFGDVVRYYYKDADQALRMMNVSKADLSKAGS